MKTYLQIVLFVVATIATTSNGCSDSCFCPKRTTTYCFNQELTQPPSGYWPNINSLDLRYNNIAVLYKFAFTGFPNVKTLSLQYNVLTELDLVVFAPLPKVDYLYLSNNRISSLTATSGVQLEKVLKIDLRYNNLSSFDPYVFLAAPNLDVLFLSHNPIVILSGQPVLYHPSISWLDMQNLTSLGVLGEESFHGLPNVQTFMLTSAGITNISTGAFVTHLGCNNILLDNNSIMEVETGSFPESGVLRLVVLDDNPLILLPTSSVADAIRPNGRLNFPDTPLACECGYESLYWWGQGKGVRVYAPCYGVELCTFTRKTNEE